MKLYIQTSNPTLDVYYKSIPKSSDSGFDLITPFDITIPAKALAFKIDHRIRCEADRGYLLFPRSSMGAKTPLRLSNSIGLIDKDYRGNIIAIVDNLSESSFFIPKGTRLVQIVAFNGEPIIAEVVNHLTDTSRGSGGFGSTGV